MKEPNEFERELRLLVSEVDLFADDDELRQVAGTYALAHRLGYHPRAVVAHFFGLSPDVAAKRIHRARTAGLLGPTTPGRKGP